MANVSQKMPVLFVGHGSPMNAVEDNLFTRTWIRIANEIPRPKAILSISAHWYTDGIRVSDEIHPKTVYDMYGFPDALYQIRYKPDGAPDFAHVTKSVISREVMVDNSWGYDHGTWSILCRMYPKADIPVFQLSVDSSADAAAHFQLGREIGALREQGVLILGSGNVVHNLAQVNWNMEGGYPWAEEFDNYIKNRIISGKYQDVIRYQDAGESSKRAFRTPDHFYPLLSVLGAADASDTLSVFNDSCTMGSLSMTSYLFQ